MLDIVCLLLSVYRLIIFGAIVLSWFPAQPGSGLERVREVVETLTEPVLGPVRQALPPLRLGGTALDLSPIVVVVALTLIQVLIGC